MARGRAEPVTDWGPTQGQIALDRLCCRVDTITLDDSQDLEYRDSTLVHDVAALPVHLTPRRRAVCRDDTLTLL
jgi:hypothetical protein